MDKINKNQTIIILIAVFIGLLLGQNTFIAEHSDALIIPLLMAMLFGLFLSIDLSELKTSFLNIKFTLVNISINFIFTPLFAYLLGLIFLSHNQAIWIGFLMLMVTPCTDWYLVFTGIAKGNVPLSTSVLPINLFLQVLLLPLFLIFFFGESGNIQLEELFKSIGLVLCIPFVLALLIKKTSVKNAIKQKQIVDFFSKTQIVFLSLAITAMFASEGASLINNPNIIYNLLIPVLLFFLIIFGVAQLASQMLRFNYENRVSLTLTTMARNSPIALAIAVSAFSHQPLIALSLVIGPLIELPVLVLTAQILLKTKR